MATTVRINESVKQQLKIKSAELGVKQIDLINRYIIEGIERDKTKKPAPSIDEIKKLLKNDLPEGDKVSEELTGLIDNPIKTNSVELKKSAYEKRGQ